MIFTNALLLNNEQHFISAVKIVDVRAKAMQKCNDLTRAGMMTVTVNAKSRLEDALHDAINAVR